MTFLRGFYLFFASLHQKILPIYAVRNAVILHSENGHAFAIFLLSTAISTCHYHHQSSIHNKRERANTSSTTQSTTSIIKFLQQRQSSYSKEQRDNASTICIIQ